MKRLLFLVSAVAFIAVVTAATSVPSGTWRPLPTFAACLVAAVAEWALFWRPLEREERRSRRRGGGLCPECGYDLRAAAAGGRCPECGEPVATPAGAPLIGHVTGSADQMAEVPPPGRPGT